ncbi:MAG: outer membrane lipoprotein chaperone LolA [Pseudomonadota bacterium]
MTRLTGYPAFQRRIATALTLFSMMLIVGPISAQPAVETTAIDTLSPQEEAALERLKRYMDDTKSLTARFSSVLLDDTGRQTAASNGTVAIKVPGRFRWQYDSPDPSLLLADGVDLWHFDEVLEQVNVSSLADYRGANPSLLLGGDSSKLAEGFKVVGSHKTEGDQWIVLETRDRNSDFVTVRIRFTDERISLMELIDRVDQTSRIAFSEVDVNADVADTLFEFTVPDGASLIGQPSPR